MNKKSCCIDFFVRFHLFVFSTLGERFAEKNWPLLAERKYSGDFRCTTTNSIKSGADKLTLNVQYGPIVKAKVSDKYLLHAIMKNSQRFVCT